MVKIILIGILIIVLNVVIQGLGSLFWLRKISVRFKKSPVITSNIILRVLIFSFVLFTVIHIVHSLIWAFCYYIIPQTAQQFDNLSEAVYFSMVTFTTLGYGDISLSSDWRLLSGLEAINGIMLIGWSTAMMFSLIQNIYKYLSGNK